jgi:hypothetical protein
MKPFTWTWMLARLRHAIGYRCGLILVSDVLYVGRLLGNGTLANLLGEQEACRARFSKPRH